MASYDEDLTYEEVAGEKNEKQIKVYALSTCGFCKRGLKFLRENSITFKFIYVDKLTYERKTELKRSLKEKFEKRAVFPYVVINDEKILLGFQKGDWEKAIL